MATQTLQPDDPAAEFFERLRKDNIESTERVKRGENPMPDRVVEQPKGEE